MRTPDTVPLSVAAHGELSDDDESPPAVCCQFFVHTHPVIWPATERSPNSGTFSGGVRMSSMYSSYCCDVVVGRPRTGSVVSHQAALQPAAVHTDSNHSNIWPSYWTADWAHIVANYCRYYYNYCCTFLHHCRLRLVSERGLFYPQSLHNYYYYYYYCYFDRTTTSWQRMSRPRMLSFYYRRRLGHSRNASH